MIHQTTTNDDNEHSNNNTNKDEQAALIKAAPSCNNSNNNTYYDSTSSSNHTKDDEEALRNKKNDLKTEEEDLDFWTMACIVSTAFAYGCILTTLFLITLPVECLRIEHTSYGSNYVIPKSVALAMFVSIAGVTQLISPFIGTLSDNYESATGNSKRLPYHVLGSILTVVGLLGQMFCSIQQYWIAYAVCFVFHMIGINIMYSMMLVMIPDEVPQHQTGITNGILALLLVMGSLFGFSAFHSILRQNIQAMYGLYTFMVLLATFLTANYLPKHQLHATSDEKQQQQQQQRRPRIQLSCFHPCRSLHAMFVQPIAKLNCVLLCKSYTIDIDENFDFFIVTVSRLFYYCGMSVQTFFLYFLHDIIHLSNHTMFDSSSSSETSTKLTAENAVALLAILAQCAGAFTCYPVGYASDQLMDGQRKPFIYLACIMLSVVTFCIIFADTINYMYICCSVLGAANGIYLTMETSLAVDTLNQSTSTNNNPNNKNAWEEQQQDCIIESSNGDHDKNGNNGDDDHHEDEEDNQDNNAQLLGIWGVAAFLGSALGPMIAGPLLYLLGGRGTVVIIVDGDDNDDSAGGTESNYGYTLPGYAAILSLSSVYFLCSALSLKFIKKNH